MISVCMIVKNEEGFIEECLKSVKSFASEIIVVDNGSTDKTNDILKKYDCKIIDGTHHDFDRARDLYLTEAKYPWILTIDADERMEPCDVDKLYSLLINTDENIMAYNLRSFQYIGEGKWADAELIRLFRNGKNISYNGSSIHATLEPSIIQQGGKILTMDWYMHHIDILFSKRTSNKRHKYIDKLISQLNNKEFKENDIHSYYLYHIFLGMEYVAMKDYVMAEKYFQEAIHNDNMFKEYAQNSLYRSYLLQDKYELIPELINVKNDDFIKDIDFYDKVDIMGNVFYKYDRKESIALYEKVISSDIARVSDYINLAYIIKDTNKFYAKKLLNIAYSLNSYLNNDLIYGLGDQPNMFHQVSCFIMDIKNVKDLFHKFGII